MGLAYETVSSVIWGQNVLKVALINEDVQWKWGQNFYTPRSRLLAPEIQNYALDLENTISTVPNKRTPGWSGSNRKYIKSRYIYIVCYLCYISLNNHKLTVLSFCWEIKCLSVRQSSPESRKNFDWKHSVSKHQYTIHRKFSKTIDI